ncbi:MAG TPA: RDD family protein [Geobacteraceae bacterium]|nr:RDD family protein [Geobacteraceae bacterium]
MDDYIIHPDSSEQARANKKLAVWIGVLGLGSFGLLYVLFFAVMMFQPGLMFKLMPFPSITDRIICDGSRTYLISQKIDVSSLDTRKQGEPRFKYFLAPLNGAALGEPREIPHYEHVAGGDNRLLFLDRGVYRIYDGSRWSEERNAAIGRDPLGLFSPAGIYVLSRGDSGWSLALIASGGTVDIPLPGDFIAAKKSDRCCCAKLALYEGRLCLFWTENESISWAILDGDKWSPPATSPYSGRYEVVSDDRSLYLFQSEGNGSDRQLSYYTYADNAWSGPVRLAPLKGVVMGWDAFMQQGKLRLFVNKMMTLTLYTVENGALANPVRLKGPFDPSMMTGRMAVMTVVTNGLTLLVIFAVSAIIRRRKKRIWQEDGAEYEFASLLRRFLALVLDKLIILVLPGIVIAFAIHGMEKELEGDPFMFIFKIFSAIALVLVGGYLYHSLLEGIFGQTLGKKLCGIRVLKADFSPCGLPAGFLRNLLRIGDAFFYYLVGVISLAATFKWQRIGDLVAETVVVKEKK